MATNFRDDAGIVRLDGTLYAPGATVGDVLTVQADGSLAPAAGGGGGAPQWEAVTVPTDAASWTGLNAPGTVTADSAPTLPLTIVVATNDTFVIVGNAPAPASETFTVAPGVYTTIAQTIAAMAAATGDDSGERFDTRITPSNSSGSILLTTAATEGSLYAQVIEGNGGAAALGFTGNPDLFTGGYGGTWTFSTGVITAPANINNEPVICTTADNFGQAWAVETEVMVADHTNVQCAFNAGAWLYQASSAEELNGSGFQLGFGSAIYSNLSGSSTQASATAVHDESWHTVRAVNLPLLRRVYFDGVLVGQVWGSTGDEHQGSDGLKESRFLLFDNIGGTSFRNLNAWRIPLPTFP